MFGRPCKPKCVRWLSAVLSLNPHEMEIWRRQVPKIMHHEEGREEMVRTFRGAALIFADHRVIYILCRNRLQFPTPPVFNILYRSAASPPPQSLNSPEKAHVTAAELEEARIDRGNVRSCMIQWVIHAIDPRSRPAILEENRERKLGRKIVGNRWIGELYFRSHRDVTRTLLQLVTT